MSIERAKTVLAVCSLTGVEKLEVIGWPGRYGKERIPSRQGDRVVIEAPQRITGERWTFVANIGGVLTCQSNVLELRDFGRTDLGWLGPAPNSMLQYNLATGEPWPNLIIKIPAHFYDNLEVKVRAEP